MELIENVSFKMKLYKIGLGVIIASYFTLMTGCATHYQVETKLVVGQKVASDTEMVQSKTLSKVVDKINVIAIKAPDQCANQTINEKTAGAVISTRCGVEMAALERSLARAGYQVVSWKLMQEAQAGGRASSWVDLAKSLNADALIQVNSLEKTKRKLPEGSKIETNYFKVNSKGKTLTSVSMDQQNNFNQLFVNSVKSSILSVERLAVTLDATLLYVPSNEAVWFYKNTVGEPINDFSATQDFLCENPCIIKPSDKATKSTDIKVTGSADNVVQQETEEDKYKDLVRQVVDDFTNRTTKVIRN